jgi:AraC-like DNA-binding protein/quercetin dioxygenase-like cupin family protein
MKPKPHPHVPPPPPAPEFFSTNVARARRFYLDLNPRRQESLVVVCGGLEHCTPDYVIERDTFPFYSIEYVVLGQGQLTFAHHSQQLEPGRIFSYGPGVPHHIRSDAGQPLVKYFVDFAGCDAAPLLNSCGMAVGSVSQVHPPNTLQGLFDELIESGLRTRREQAELCRNLLQCLALKARANQVPVAETTTLAFHTYQHCHQLISRHFLRLRTLEQIAAECHVSNAHLCRLFRRYDHQSPYQFLLQLKMRAAAEWLQQPGSLVKQVAERTGFSDPFHFSRVFKNVLGLSPESFRRMR